MEADRDGPEIMILRVFLLDDHEIVRRGLRELLDAEPDMQVIGEAATAADGRAAIPDANPDVALLDVRLPDGSGIEVCRDIRTTNPHIACIVLTSFADDEAVSAAVLAGAAGYVLKQVRGGDLVGAIRRVGHGESLLDPKAAARAVERLRLNAGDEDLWSLTAQERRILANVSEGLTNRQIAERMGLAEKTVKNYVSNTLAKLGMARRTEAAAYGARMAERRTHDEMADATPAAAAIVLSLSAAPLH